MTTQKQNFVTVYIAILTTALSITFGGCIYFAKAYCDNVANSLEVLKERSEKDITSHAVMEEWKQNTDKEIAQLKQKK